MGTTRRLPALALAALLLVTGCGRSELATPSAPAPDASGVQVVLTSPPPPVPDGLADPSTPAWQPDTGFTSDTVKVLTVTTLRLSLEQYRAANGAYPADLAALFPDYAPAGEHGSPMTGPPPAADGYAYSPGGSGYTLSVRLAGGSSYTTTEASR